MQHVSEFLFLRAQVFQVLGIGLDLERDHDSNYPEGNFFKQFFYAFRPFRFSKKVRIRSLDLFFNNENE